MPPYAYIHNMMGNLWQGWGNLGEVPIPEGMAQGAALRSIETLKCVVKWVWHDSPVGSAKAIQGRRNEPFDHSSNKLKALTFIQRFDATYQRWQLH